MEHNIDAVDHTLYIARLIEAGTNGTALGARWVLTVMEHHPDLLMLRDVLVDWDRGPWIAVTRSADEVLEMARPYGWQAERVDREPNGLFGVVTMVRR